jgi:hypothetical protein
MRNAALLAFLLLTVLFSTGCVVRHPGRHYHHPPCPSTCVEYGYRDNCHTRCRAWNNGVCVAQRNVCERVRYCVQYASQCP